MTGLLRRFLKFSRRISEANSAHDWVPLFARRAVGGSIKGLHRWYHRQQARGAISGRSANIADIEFFLASNSVRLKLPLVLISQVQRSGGTLLSQLFDAHPQIAAYPHEFRQTFSTPDMWPSLDVSRGCDFNFRLLFDLNFTRLVRRGFSKGEHHQFRHPFMLISSVEYAVFKSLWNADPPRTSREILDHFFTAFFNSWLNYQGRLEDKKWITAFAPRLAHEESNVAAFLECYPEGRLIQLVRGPQSWFPSARKHRKGQFKGRSDDYILKQWCNSVRSIIQNSNRYGDRVMILRFEDLIENTEATMRAVSKALDIEYASTLTEPTFNGRPMRANSSFSVESAGVISNPLYRKRELTKNQKELVCQTCGSLYEELLRDRNIINCLTSNQSPQLER